MRTFAERLDAAIEASGKSQNQVATEARIAPETLSRYISGESTNPTLDVLVRLAKTLETTVGALNGDSIQLSQEDREALARFRDWIDEKSATLDALEEPNAVVLDGPPLTLNNLRIADQTARGVEPPSNPFGSDATLILRATGDSMHDAGILAGDTLYAIPRRRTLSTSTLGKIVAFTLGEKVFVKRLTSVRRRHFLLSANPRYRPIEVDPDDPQFVILGTVVGRLGRVG